LTGLSRSAVGRKEAGIEDLAEQDAGDELPPRFSARRRAAIRACRSRSTLRFRRQSLSFAFGKKMKIPAHSFSKDAIAALPEKEREARLLELGSLLNAELAGIDSLPEFQKRLYSLIKDLGELGFSLGPWDYDSEVEIWGGPSYMDKSKEDDLLLRSEFPKGITLAWKDYERL
jgi:hypothetical protein